MRHAGTCFAIVLALSACAQDEIVDGDLGSVEQPVWWPSNGQGTEALTSNGVTANEANNLHMTSMGFTSAILDPGFRDVAAYDPLAAEFLDYWASCALAPNDTIELPNNKILRGSLGLCPSWKDSAPSLACQQSVSACVLARNNRDRHKVIFSERGPTPNGRWVWSIFTNSWVWFQTNLAVAAQMVALRESSPGIVATSAQTCATSSYPAERRNCGWRPAYVGTAIQGFDLLVSAGPYNLGSSTGDTMLRVCKGYQPCDYGSANHLGSVDDTQGYGVQPSITVRLQTTDSGVFSVYWAPYSIADTTSTASPATSGASNHYPASELQVFAIAEGAFYGNLFLQDGQHLGWQVSYNPLTAQRTITGGNGDRTFVYPDMYACSAPGWDNAVGYFSNRLCALGACAATYTGECTSACNSFATSDQTYRGCHGGNTTFAYPISSNVQTACELVTDSFACSRPVPIQ